MNKILPMLAIVFGLTQITIAQVITAVPCDQLGMVINVGSQETAISIYHSGQYMTHPRSQNVFTWEFTDQQGNVLHQDTLEDTNTDIDEINAIFGNKIIAAVSALTKNALLPSKEERMMDSLERINRLEKEVGIVKLADRITNLQPPPKSWSKEKISNYLKQSRLISNQLKEKNDYLNKRLDLKIEAYAKILA